MVGPGGGRTVKVVSGFYPNLDVPIMRDVVLVELVVLIIWNVLGTSPNFCFPYFQGDFRLVFYCESGISRVEIEVEVSPEVLLASITDFPGRWWKQHA
jgi:hypothetical protein